MKKIIDFIKSKINTPKLSIQKLDKAQKSPNIVRRKYNAEIALTYGGIRIAKFPVSITAMNSAAAKTEIIYKLGFEVIRIKQDK